MVMLIVFAVFVAANVVLPFFYKADIRRKRAKDPHYRPVNVMGVFSEIYQPDAHAASQIYEAQKVVPAKAPVPGDPLGR